METMRQQQQQHDEYLQHRQAVRPLLVSSSTRSTPTFPGDDDDIDTSTQLCGGDAGVWIMSQGSWKKNNPHPETRYAMPQINSLIRSVSPSKKANGNGSSGGASVSSRESSSSSSARFKNKRLLYQKQPTRATTDASPDSNSGGVQVPEQREAASNASFLRSEAIHNLSSSNSETSFFDEPAAAVSNTSITGVGEQLSDADLSRSSFSERLEHMSRLAERHVTPTTPKRSPSSTTRAVSAAESAAPRRSSPLLRQTAPSSSSGRGGMSSTPTRKLSPNKALFLRRMRQKQTQTLGHGNSSAKDAPEAAPPLQSPAQPPQQLGRNSSSSHTRSSASRPARPAYLTLLPNPSSSSTTAARSNKVAALQPQSSRETPATTTTTTTEQQPCSRSSSSSGSKTARTTSTATTGTTTTTSTTASTPNSRFARRKRFGRSRSFSGSAAAAGEPTSRSTTPPHPLLLRSPSMTKSSSTSSSSSSLMHHDSDDLPRSSNTTSHEHKTSSVTIVVAPAGQRNQNWAVSAATATATIANKPRKLLGETPLRSTDEVPPLVVESSSDSSSSASSDNHYNDTNMAGYDKQQKSVIPATRVQPIHAAFGCDCDLYKDVLLVSREATDAQIRIAYFRRGRQVLADATTTTHEKSRARMKKNKNKDSCATVMADLPVSQKEKFQAVSLAYEILCKPSWKREYDTHGWKLAAQSMAASTATPKPKADCQVTTSTTITDIPGVKITSTTSTAEETSSPSFVSYRMDSPHTTVSELSAALSSEQSLSILRNPNPANLLASSSNMSHISDRSSVNGNSISRTRIRWSEEVEELVYRQDPEESRFKMRGTHSYDDEESGSGSEGSASSATSSSGSRDYDHDDDDVAVSEAQGDIITPSNENILSPENESDRSKKNGEDEAWKPKTKTKKKMIVVDSDSIHRRLSKLEKKTFENTFVTSFLNDIDRSLDGLEDSFDGLFGRSQRIPEMADDDDDDDDDDDEIHQPDSSVKIVDENKAKDLTLASNQLVPVNGVPSSPLTVFEGVDDDHDSAVLHLFSELTKPVRVLFHDPVALSEDSPPSTDKPPSDKKSPTSTIQAVDRSMEETERAFSPILHQEELKDPFGFPETKSENFEDGFDPFNDSFQIGASDEDEEKQVDPFQPGAKAIDTIGEFHSCSTPSSLHLNKEPVEPRHSKPLSLRHGSTRNRVPLRSSTPTPPPATESYHMEDTSSPSSPIRGDTIFPRTHSGMSSLTGPASFVTNDTEFMLQQAEGKGNLCTGMMAHRKDGETSVVGKKGTSKKESDENQDFFSHFISYMDALSRDFQAFSQGPCRVVDEAKQVIFDAVVIPEENLESMLAAFNVDGPPSCMDNSPPPSTEHSPPAMTRSYTF